MSQKRGKGGVKWLKEKEFDLETFSEFPMA
jgi:hypothetical protein